MTVTKQAVCFQRHPVSAYRLNCQARTKTAYESGSVQALQHDKLCSHYNVKEH